MLAGMEEVGTGLLDRLDAMQRVAASAPGGPMLIVAGPGTGKTRTLTHRIAYLCAELGVYPEHCLAITFTRRAAEELRTRLDGLLGPVAEDVTVATFHSLGLTILRENAATPVRPAGRTSGIADEAEPPTAAGEPSGRSRAEAGDDDATYVKLLRGQDLVDLDELVTLPVTLLRADPALVDALPRAVARGSSSTSTRTSTPPSTSCCACSAPPTATSARSATRTRRSTRSAAPTSATSCASPQDFTDARLVRLTRNYRSSAPILAAAVQAIAPTSLVRGRRLDPARLDPEAPLVGRYAAASVADEADFVVRTVDELVGGVSHRSLDSGRVDGRVTADGLLLRHRGALPHRRAGRPDRRRAVPGRHPGAEALARPAARPARGGRRSPGSCGTPTASAVRSPPGYAWPGRCSRERFAAPDPGRARPGSDRRTIWSAVELLTPLARRCGDDLDAVPDPAGHRSRGRRARPARRGGHPAHPARGEGPGVPGRLPGRLRGRPAAAAAPREQAGGATRWPRSAGCSSSG